MIPFSFDFDAAFDNFDILMVEIELSRVSGVLFSLRSGV